MMIPLCNHQLSLPSTTLNPKPSPNSSFFFTHFNQNLRIHSKFVLTRTSIAASAAEADTQTLPQSAIQRIADKLRSLGYVEEDDDSSEETLNFSYNSNNASPGEIFVPLPSHLPKHRVGHTMDPSWSTPENPVPEPGSGSSIRRYHELRRVFLKEKEEEKVKRKEEERDRVPTLAELTLPRAELRRLRAAGIGLKKKLKVGKAGITEGIVNGIHERWRTVELVKIVCEDLCKMNMKRTHDLLERKTGGLVIWRSGSNIILYRGANYKYPYFFSDNNSTNHTSASTSPGSGTDSDACGQEQSGSSGMDGESSGGLNRSNVNVQSPLIHGVGSPNRVRFQLPGEAQLAEEADRMLEGLGPRFTDWWGYDPLPVDADLLPAVVPGYKRPFRLLPYGVKPKLTNDEMTILRRLARPLPCHFALSRNRKLQGLAASIVKLWEKCEIAKIAVKRGVQNTNSELMAEELKLLTGGTLLSRDKEFITFYRGKDFLPAAVSLAIEERRKCGIHREKHKTDYSSSPMAGQDHKSGTLEGGSEHAHYATNDLKLKPVSERRKQRSTEAAFERTNAKLNMALINKARAEELLAELENEEIRHQPEIDKEGITEEERYMLRKVGLRMKPFLLMGRRGVFAGTVENMHLHWKYRELVKIMCSARSIEEIHGVARTLEAESGGILVAVEKVGKVFAIIVYRGKNYQRPACLRPQTLLSKREAMKRSIEAQRRESLKLHVLKLTRNIDELKLQLAKDKEVKSTQLVNDSEVHLVKEQEVNKMHFTEELNSDSELETNGSSCLVTRPCTEETAEARERYGAGSGSFEANEDTNSARDCQETYHSNVRRDFSSQYEEKEEDDFDTSEQKASSKFVLEESVTWDTDGEGGNAESSISHDNLLKQNIVSVESPKRGTKLSPHRSVENGSTERPLRARAVWLSNRDRLLLRKQALKMKKRPVLAVGKSNIVSGVAKAIKTHFQKHPLAIVNVKGRAKGTSVQEVVSELEQATGAVLVSQEPSKVILYRGWGMEVELDQTVELKQADMKKTPANVKSENLPVVSPELMSAIRLECGFPQKQQDQEIV